jgi:hypothetical protein
VRAVARLTAFDGEAIYDKPNCTPKLAATVTPELIQEPEKTRPSSGRSGNSGRISIAGAGYEHLSPTGWRIVEVRELG